MPTVQLFPSKHLLKIRRRTGLLPGPLPDTTHTNTPQRSPLGTHPDSSDPPYETGVTTARGRFVGRPPSLVYGFRLEALGPVGKEDDGSCSLTVRELEI